MSRASRRRSCRPHCGGSGGTGVGATSPPGTPESLQLNTPSPFFESIQYPTVAYHNPTCPFGSYRNRLTVSFHVVCANFVKYCSVLAVKIPHPF